MTTDGDNSDITGSDEPLPTTASSVSEWVGEAAHAAVTLQTGIPPALQKSAIKVIGRLMTSLIAYPTTLIESAARERKAESDARIRLINVSKTQIAAQMKVDPAYAVAAAQKYAERIVRSQTNLDSIANQAMAELGRLPAPDPSAPLGDVPPVDDDWLNAFESEASQMSSEHAQRIFARILAGEIHKPGAFSKRTLKLMGQLDNHAAAVFSRACSMAVSMRAAQPFGDARIIGLGKIGSNSLSQYDLSYVDCTLLQDYGLVVSDLGGYADYQSCLAIDGRAYSTFEYMKSHWVLVPKAPIDRVEFRFEGMQFSASGRELLAIVELHENESYTAALQSHFDQRGMVMTALKARTSTQ